MRILILDDDKNLRKILKNELCEEGYDIEETDSGLKALDMLEKDEFDVLVLDLNMPGFHGLDVLKKIRALDIPVEVIILTGHGTVSSAVEAMKLGAYDFLTKPFELKVLKAIVDKAYEKKELRNENLHLKVQMRRQTRNQAIITGSPSMLEILESLKKVAQSDFPVLVEGESGVGKELVARAIHDESKRKDGPFIPINCSAIPENMLETELFGHEKGAFTGAIARKLGLLEIGEHGSVFLDEIAELSTHLQGKLLRAIETGSFFRVGGVKEAKVDVRYIAATNKDIKKEVEKGQFRTDLYYRIGALGILVPPLRERKEDIPLLVSHFLQTSPVSRKKQFSPEALTILSEYSWPGNVRELQNVVQRTLLLSKRDIIEPDDLPSDLTPVGQVSGKRLEDLEKEHILKVLREVKGQRGRAAQILGVDPKTLYRKLLSYGVTE